MYSFSVIKIQSYLQSFASVGGIKEAFDQAISQKVRDGADSRGAGLRGHTNQGKNISKIK